jgi:uncharacterized protein (TIGR02302 family)
MNDREARRHRAERYIATARLVVLWERFWPALWPGMGILGAGMILALVGFFSLLPGVVHALLLIAFFTVLLYALYRSFVAFRMPRWEDGARRVERDSELPNRPITEGSDQVQAGRGDPFAERLWRAHVVRLLASARNLRLRRPTPGLAQRDPHGIRFAVLLGLIAGLIYAGPESGQRLVSGLVPVFGDTIDNSAFVAWVSPPPYTNLPPRALTDTTIQTDNTGSIPTPVNSTLVMRLRGTASRPTIDARPMPKGGEPKFTRGDSGYEAKLNIPTTSHVTIRLGSHSYGDWHFTIIPDKRPTIAFAETPSRQQNGSLKLSYKAGDDYGVVKAAALIRPLDDNGNEIKSAQTLRVELPVPGGRQINETVYRDLSAHPYAGSKVHIWLMATDAAGQWGTSPALTITLPARVFTEPLAKALIEQRKGLAMQGEKYRDHARTVIDALSIGPDEFYKDDYGNYLAMRSLNYQLGNAKADPSAERAQAFMWDMALAIEEGDLANAAEELRKLQDQLMDALERGAPDEEIKALMDKLRQALARYMQQLAKNMKPGQMGQMPPGARMMSQRDLQDLLKAIEDLARTGNRDQARQMLAALMQMLENMRMVAGRGGQGQQGQGQQNQGTPQQNAMNNALNSLGQIMGGQRQLLDRTFRAQQGQQGQGQQGQGQQQGQQGQGQFGQFGQGQQGQQQGQPGQGQFGQQFGQGGQFGQQGQPYPGGPNGQQAQPGLAPGQLAQEQQSLQDQLDKAIQGLGQNGVPVPQGLNDAQRQMGQSQGDLSGSQFENSEQAQQQVLENLRNSAQQLAQTMMAQAGQQPGAQQQGQRTDPLGRPLDQNGSMAGGNVQLPDKSELERAREILEELRRRAGEANRAPEELDYIERLLKQF